MTLLDICPADWRSALSDVLTSVTAQGIENQLTQELASGNGYYPRFHRLFAALEGLSPRDVRVVILGQDPYHGEHQATGRAFEVFESTPAPPSLVNIGKMLERDLGVAVGNRFQIGRWSEQGVLLLNTTLSVRAGEPESHKGLGWQTITDRIISVIAASEKPTVFLLWGAHAQRKSVLVNGPQNLVLTAPHPSPLSAYRGFFDCAHFSATNQWLTSGGAGYSMGVCLLIFLLGGLSGEGYCFGRVAAQFNIQSGYVGDNLAEAKEGIFIFDYLHD